MSLPDAKVTSAEAYEEMRRYLLDLHNEIEVELTYCDHDGQSSISSPWKATPRFGETGVRLI